MKKLFLLCSSALVAPMAITVVAAPAMAQQITTEINGQVTDASGAPIPNATVVVTDTRTGAATTINTNNEGRYSARNLSTGGPYTVTVTASDFQGQTIEQVSTTLQGPTAVAFSLDRVSEQVTTETIVVTATRARVTQLATGPGTSFSTDVMETAPSFNRDIRDVIRIDPRVSLSRDDLSGQDRVSCLGGNDRGNAFTVDGIAQSDIYGLNETGFSARSSTPIPYDAVRETQVQFAPFDVEYGQFTGCAINVVTRSGSNKFHGGGFFEYTDNDLMGDKLDGIEIITDDFTDKRWGASLGGPIIKDRLFFFGAYEKHKSADSHDSGPTGAGYSTEIPAITEAQFNQVSQILKDVYGIDTGPLARSLPFTNERWFGRLDWQITDDHRLEGTYQRLEEARTASDDFFTGNSPQVAGLNTFQISGSVSDFYSARLYSNWTDNFSTEVRYSRAKSRDRQDPIGGGEAQSANPIPRIIVGIDNPPLGSGPVGQNPPDGTILAGPGISRSANDLRTTIDQFKAAAKLELGNHSLKFGIESNHAKIFNLFVQNATGTLVFRNITDLQNGLLSQGTGSVETSTLPFRVTGGITEGAFGNFTASGNINDAAAKFSRTIYSVYAQDDWRITDNLQLVGGIRVEMFEGDSPTFNPNFQARYGFGNNTGFDDIEAIYMPRVAATYDVNDFSVFTRTKVRGGLGIFSGGDPLVWFGNAFQNDGATFGQGTTQAAGCPAGQIDVVVGGVFTGVPQCAIDQGAAAAATGQAFTQSIDPDIKMPTVLRLNLGLETTLNLAPGFLSGWRVNADYIFSRFRDPFTIVDLAQAVNPSRGLNGFTIDGRPIYSQIDLTRAGCTGELVDPGAPPVFENLNAACFFSGTGSRVDELMLANANAYNSQIASFLISKDFDRGILTSGGGVYFSAGYAYTDAHDRRNMLNSTAGSNYDNVATFDRQNPAESRGFYGQTHNFTVSTTFREQFFDDLDTKFGFTFIARSGRPYSLTFSSGGVFNASASGNDNALAYIPSGLSDPNISPSSTISAAAFDNLMDFIDDHKCAREARGRTIKRNTCSNDWYVDMDLRFSQELPGPGRFFGQDDKIEVYAMVDNFLNLLNDEWNIFRRRQFSGFQDVISTSGVDAQGRYIITGFTGGTFENDNEIKNSSSLWRLKLGVNYRF